MEPLLAKDYMTANVVTLRPDMDLLEAVNKLIEKRVPGAPVVDHLGDFIGILVERDCLSAVLNAVYFNDRGGRVESFMHRNVEVVQADTSISEVAQKLIKTGHRGFPVVKENRLVGMINRSDVLKAMLRALDNK